MLAFVAFSGALTYRPFMSATAIDAKVMAQYELFSAALPGLRGRYEGRWVVWLDRVLVVLNTEEEAFAWVDANLPLHSGCVIARVESQDPVLLSAAFAFGAAR